MQIENDLIKRAKKRYKTIVFPEAGFSERIIEAAKIIQKRKIAKVILIGDESSLVLRDKKLADFIIYNPKTSELSEKFAKTIYSKRKEKGITLEKAKELILNPFYFGTMLVNEGIADGMVGGAEVPTAENIRPALQLIKGEKKNGIVSSYFVVFGKNEIIKNKVLLLSDCGLNVNPSAKELNEIARQTVQSAKQICKQEPKVAFLSYSTKGSAKSNEVGKVKEAFEMFKKSGIICDGEMQMDAALIKGICAHKAPESSIKGDANILIFPDLNSGNITYKAIQYFGKVSAIGPVLQGLKKPVNDLSRGCTVKDIILLTAITALQVKDKE